MNISVIGGGYVGLTTSVGLATKGHVVTCIDIDEKKVTMINRAEPPFYQDQLGEVLHTCVKEKGNLTASSDYNEVVASEATFICVSTSSNGGKNADFSAVRHSATKTAEALCRKSGYHLVVMKSSVVPGTTEGVVLPILEEQSCKKAGEDFGVAVNPEFLQEGKALHSFLNSDRIIIGQYDQKSGDIVQKIYCDFRAPVLRTGIRTAEMIKFASNAFLATRVSFINEIGNVCKKLGVDVYEVAAGMGYDPRIGRAYLNAGVGFGGSCLPKDLEALIHKCAEAGEGSSLLRAVYQVNRGQIAKLMEITRGVLGTVQGKTVAVLGMAFKANTDDIRNAPAFEIIHALLREGARVVAYDPKAIPKAREALPREVEYAAGVEDAVAACDCVLILTEWDQFKNERLYLDKVVIDGRRVLDPDTARRVCRHYEGVCW